MQMKARPPQYPTVPAQRPAPSTQRPVPSMLFSFFQHTQGVFSRTLIMVFPLLKLQVLVCLNPLRFYPVLIVTHQMCLADLCHLT